MKAVTNLKVIRKQIGTSVQELAACLDVSCGTIRSWENGGRIQTKKLENLENYIDNYNLLYDTDYKLNIVDCAYNESVAIEGAKAGSEEPTATYEEAEASGVETVQKVYAYVRDDMDNPIIEKFFGKDWNIGDVICNTDAHTMKQFVTAYEQIKDIHPCDVVTMNSGNRMLEYAVLCNNSGVLVLYRDGEITNDIPATKVYKQKNKQWGIVSA